MLPRTNMRFVYLKRNLFVYLQYFQWFSKNLNMFVSSWRKSFYRFLYHFQMQKHGISKKRNVVFFFLTKSTNSFFNIIARSFSRSLGFNAIHFQWNPLFFYCYYQQLLEGLLEAFPIFFVDPNLLLDRSFRPNFISIFNKCPVFLLGDYQINTMTGLWRDLFLLKRVYPLYIPTGAGFYLFLFWLRFLLKLF